MCGVWGSVPCVASCVWGVGCGVWCVGWGAAYVELCV